MDYRHIPESMTGKHVKISSILDSEDVQLQLTAYINEHEGMVKARTIRQWLQTTLSPSMNIEANVQEQTVQRWLNKLGYNYERWKRGLYKDGHEREDVVEYRARFLAQMQQFEEKMPVFEGEDMNVIKMPSLGSGEKLHILVVHDEWIFHANDADNYGWYNDGNQGIRPKGQGASIHVSEFLSEMTGRLKLQSEQVTAVKFALNRPDFPQEARVIIHPGRNRDGYWTKDHLWKQLQDAIAIFEVTHPGCVGVFLFDNAASQGAYAPDALVASKMNMNDGGISP